ncbi:hypothetical protein GUI32_07665, partial [Escherichia coli]|nr:hypothetical protein [Escherichia coli]NAA06717.1 hypothetical protein [Escherichia coli]
GTVCVVGKIRDLILQLSKSSIYSTKPINGISHNPAERTNITDLAEGVKTLALMLYQLAWQK